MVDIDRMIEGQTVLLDDARFPARFGGCLEDDLAKQALVHKMGAGKSQKQAFRPEVLKSQPVDVFVAPAGRDNIPSLFGKGGRVEDDKIIK